MCVFKWKLYITNNDMIVSPCMYILGLYRSIPWALERNSRFQPTWALTQEQIPYVCIEAATVVPWNAVHGRLPGSGYLPYGNIYLPCKVLYIENYLHHVVLYICNKFTTFSVFLLFLWCGLGLFLCFSLGSCFLFSCSLTTNATKRLKEFC